MTGRDDSGGIAPADPNELALKACSHILIRCMRDAALAYHMCPLTESFALLTEALAALTDRTSELAELRAAWADAINQRLRLEDPPEVVLRRQLDEASR